MKWFEKLKFARRVKGWSLREAADKAGISNAYLCQIESGKINDPSFFKTVNLMNLYNLSLKTLIDPPAGD